MKRTIAVFLALALCLTGCLDGKPRKRTPEMVAASAGATDFAVRLFRTALEEERNTLISPPFGADRSGHDCQRRAGGNPETDGDGAGNG